MSAQTTTGSSAILLRERIDTAEPLSAALIGRITAVCDRAEDADGEVVVVLDLGDELTPRAWPGDVGVHLVGKWEQALRRLERVPAATIATATGRCGRPALELLLATDHRIAGDDLLLDTGGGEWPGMVLHRLVTQLGVAGARRLLHRAGPATAAELVRLGVVAERTADVEGSVAEVSALLGGVPEPALRRQLLLEAATVGFEEALGAHLAACDRTLRRRAEGGARR